MNDRWMLTKSIGETIAIVWVSSRVLRFSVLAEIVWNKVWTYKTPVRHWRCSSWGASDSEGVYEDHDLGSTIKGGAEQEVILPEPSWSVSKWQSQWLSDRTQKLVTNLRRYHWERMARRKDTNVPELIPTLKKPSSATNVGVKTAFHPNLGKRRWRTQKGIGTSRPTRSIQGTNCNEDIRRA